MFSRLVKPWIFRMSDTDSKPDDDDDDDDDMNESETGMAFHEPAD
jgi:hypothetical protein